MVIFVSGCATNWYKKSYHDETKGVDPFKSGLVIMTTANPEIVIGGEDVRADNIRMSEDNYALLGYSSFWSVHAKNEQAIKFGKEIHAEKILLYEKYKDTRSGVVPMTLPSTQTSYTQGMIGSRPVSARTTSYGTQTNYFPYSVDRYDYLASYWVKIKNLPVLGVICDDLSDEQRKQISSNKGVVVIGVMKNTPAFIGDLFKGDIIKKIDGSEIIDRKMFGDLLNKINGKKITITLLRDGKEVNKTIQTNSRPSIP